MEDSNKERVKLTRVATYSCFYCQLLNLGEPEVIPYEGKLLTKWNIHFAGHHWAIAEVSDKPLGHGKTCTCEKEIPWGIYGEAGCEEAVEELVRYLSDGEYKQVESPDDIED